MESRWTSEEVASVMEEHVFFGGLSPAQRRTVIEFSRMQTAGDGEILFQTGDRYRGLYLVLEGTVQIYRLNDAGRMLVLHVIRAGETFAEVPMFEHTTRETFPATAEPLEESVLLFVPKEPFLSFIDDHPRAGLSMLGKMAERLRGAVRQLDALSLQDVKGRLAQHLCRLEEELSAPTGDAPATGAGSAVVDLDVPKSVLAAELGTVPETLSRALSDLEDEGLIRRQGERIELTDLPSLKRLGRAR